MRIVILRHGQPSMPTLPAISAADFGNWISTYNQATLCSQSHPAADIIALAAGCNTVVCSHLSRSTESAARLGLTRPHIIDAAFREMEMPFARLSRIKLPASIWSVIFRILWFAGFSRNSESFTAAKARATAAAGRLEQLAREKDSVIFIGHGFLNKFIARQLRANGWQGPQRLANDYWSYAVFTLSDKLGTP